MVGVEFYSPLFACGWTATQEAEALAEGQKLSHFSLLVKIAHALGIDTNLSFLPSRKNGSHFAAGFPVASSASLSHLKAQSLSRTAQKGRFQTVRIQSQHLLDCLLIN
jgi:hypothetical protein